jgi:hypothetical protein
MAHNSKICTVPYIVTVRYQNACRTDRRMLSSGCRAVVSTEVPLFNLERSTLRTLHTVSTGTLMHILSMCQKCKFSPSIVFYAYNVRILYPPKTVVQLMMPSSPHKNRNRHPSRLSNSINLSHLCAPDSSLWKIQLLSSLEIHLP